MPGADSLLQSQKCKRFEEIESDLKNLSDFCAAFQSNFLFEVIIAQTHIFEGGVFNCNNKTDGFTCFCNE